MNDTSVLCIGLDAACAKQIDPLIERDIMPNVEALRNQGTSGTLTTTTPPWTPSAWPSITTGTTPWTHGIYDFYDYTTEEPHLVSATDLQVPFLWEYLDQLGHTSIILNVPVTHPIHRVSGSIVPGYLAPEDSQILLDGEPAPQSMLKENYRVYARKTDSREAKISENEALIDSRLNAAKYLTEHHEWSFLMVQFQRTDSIFHTMGHDTEAIERVYSQVDDAIGSLLEIVDDDTHVVIVSDHGMHEYNRVFRCNSWLHNEGWLQTSAESERHSWGETTKPTQDKSDKHTTFPHRTFSAVLTALRTLGITPQRAEKALSIVGLADPIRQQLPANMLLDVAEHVHWESSQAYCRSVSSLGIRCNVEGRDSGGVISPSEFSAARTKLIEMLETVHAPDGTPVFEDVYDRHERHGTDVANEASAPDIVVRPKEMKWKITDIVREPVFNTTDEFSHKYEGLFITAGPSIASDTNIDLKATDVAPTILEMFGQKPTPIMEGNVPSELLNIDRHNLSDTPVPGKRTYLTEESHGSSETVTNRLKQLGYLE
jgi:predicted AlkP superfamily phosphohydrolase/phosphomutase